MTFDQTIFDSPNPMSAALDAFADKVTRTEAPFYGGKALDAWLTDEGGGHLFAFDGSCPVDFEPPPGECPALLLYFEPGNPWEFRGEGDRRFSIGMWFEGWLYDTDQRKATEFAWLTLSAAGYPWMEPGGVDPLTDVPFIHSYQPSGPLGIFPFASTEGDTVRFAFKFVVEFAGELPFFRGL